MVFFSELYTRPKRPVDQIRFEYPFAFVLELGHFVLPTTPKFNELLNEHVCSTAKCVNSAKCVNAAKCVKKSYAKCVNSAKCVKSTLNVSKVGPLNVSNIPTLNVSN